MYRFNELICTVSQVFSQKILNLFKFYSPIPNDILDANLKNNISYQEMLSKHDKKLEKEEKEKADTI